MEEAGPIVGVCAEEGKLHRVCDFYMEGQGESDSFSSANGLSSSKSSSQMSTEDT